MLAAPMAPKLRGANVPVANVPATKLATHGSLPVRIRIPVSGRCLCFRKLGYFR
jgi:hypothetical protein